MASFPYPNIWRWRGFYQPVLLYDPIQLNDPLLRKFILPLKRPVFAAISLDRPHVQILSPQYSLDRDL